MNNTRLSLIGSRAVLFEIDCPFKLVHQEQIWALIEEASQWDCVREAVAGMTNLTLLLTEVPKDLNLLERKLTNLWAKGTRHEIDGKLLEIDLTYGGAGGPHLADVAQMTNLTIDEIIKIHSAHDYTVYAVGSHAGYCYLGGLDKRLETPRRQVPLARLPSGSLSIAGLQTGISASAGPSGWNTIGSAQVSFFEPDQSPPALLQPGDRIRFKPAEVIA